ncbi:MAG: NAD-glutamate dehydrogenase domain-containing protein [Candidatus Binatia bacterium]
MTRSKKALAKPTEPPALARLLAEIRSRLPAEQQEPAEGFARELFARAADLLNAVDRSMLVALAVDAFRFFRARGHAPFSVRVFVPDRDRNGWTGERTVVQTALDDRPFIVDTLTEVIESEGGVIHLLRHPILGVERERDGAPLRVGPADAYARRESFLHLEVAGLPPSAALERRITARLRDLIAATDDYAPMRRRLAEITADMRAQPLPEGWEPQRAETVQWLEWLADRRFVFLGYREYDLRGADAQRLAAVRRETGLGILRDAGRSRFATEQPLGPALQSRVDAPQLALVSKTNAISPVHRPVRMDDIALKEVDAAGTVIGVRRLLGLFTAKAYADPASATPILRQIFTAILRREGVVFDSHDYRDLEALYNSFPREELFASRAADIHAAIRAIRRAEAEEELEVHARRDAVGRGIFVHVVVPRARFSTDLHARITAAVAQIMGGAVLHAHLALDDRLMARLHYYVAADDQRTGALPVEALRDAVSSLLRTWDEGLREVLSRTLPADAAERSAARYAAVFPPAYKAATDVVDAAHDVARIEALLATGQTQIELVSPHAGAAALRLYLGNEVLALSDFVPVLEHLGLRVLGQDIIELPALERRVAIHNFAVEPTAAGGADLAQAAPRIVATVHAVRNGEVDDDRLNTLVLAAGLEWHAVDVLRAVLEHARQIGIGHRHTLQDALTANPASAGHLFALFAAKFDPHASALAAGERLNGPVAEAERVFTDGLAAVPSLTDDRILRAFANAIAATVRTNVYARVRGEPIVLKFDATRLTALPPPTPLVETWVHAVGMQGIHLRSGRVARGGIRYSDRPDDFRTEILGLMRTQVVKNAVIVPVGAKGGFILKGLRDGAVASAERIQAAYRAFIDALLSITDNVESARPGPPHGLIMYDHPDPYLVVAADKGTAAFSDLANARAAARGFWLGDAFASGGSTGYDHKKLGITARGAWECARHHFREMGRDLDREEVTAIGIGDMSGDVFGNGLLLSSRIRLLGAFDHRHVFVDPDPDPERAYRERQRLFDLPRSSWADYAKDALSAGGGVYARAAKEIPLSAEARALLGLAEPAPSGESVVRAILRLKVDLLWNGGIGTYVKASDETHAEVGDPANDAVRVDASALGAAVVLEGGNLGVTQRGRVEYALGGGRINTDAIDNSGGVDCSDHEVNLKIALRPVVASGALGAGERNRILRDLSAPVMEAVLAHNRSQARALSLDHVRSRTRLADFRDLLGRLETDAAFDRQLAYLPTRETLRLRRGIYLGLTRPELAVLLAATKLDLRKRLLHSRLCDDPELEQVLSAYFPHEFATRFPEAVLGHPLRREIIAVQLAGQLVDQMGMTFLVRAARDTGRGVPELVGLWVVAHRLAEGDALDRELGDARATLPAEADQRCAFALESALERAVLWLADMHPSSESLTALLWRWSDPTRTVLAAWPDWLGPGERATYLAEVRALTEAAVPVSLAERLAKVTALAEALEIAHIGAIAGVPLRLAAEAYGEIGASLELNWVRKALPGAFGGEDRWEPRAAAVLLDGLRQARRQITRDVLADCVPGRSVAECFAAYAAARREQIEMVLRLVSDSKAAPQPSLPALLVVMRELGRLARPPVR